MINRQVPKHLAGEVGRIIHKNNAGRLLMAGKPEARQQHFASQGRTLYECLIADFNLQSPVTDRYRAALHKSVQS